MKHFNAVFGFSKTLQIKAILRTSGVLFEIALLLRMPHEAAINRAWQLLVVRLALFSMLLTYYSYKIF